jgi:glycosyltransferase involved in cell wall biosynthesis
MRSNQDLNYKIPVIIIMKYSFILCTSNSERIIQHVLQSIAIQKINKNNFEIIFVDYKSNDNTVELVKKFVKINKIKITKLNTKKGKSRALEVSLDCAKGEYAIIVDDDNILASNFIKKVDIFFRKNKNVALVGSQGILDKKLILPSWFERYKSHYAIGTINRDSDWIWGACSIIKVSAWKELRNIGFKFFINPTRKNHINPILIGGEDGELSLAFKLLAYKVNFNLEIKFIHSFSQDRLNLDFFFQNLKGTSASIPILEIYRVVDLGKNFNFSKLLWILRISKIMLSCLIKVLINIVVIKKIEIKYYYTILITVFINFFRFASTFDKLYVNLTKIKNFNKLQSRI